MKHPLSLSLCPWLLAAGVLVYAEGFGQTMYRCGNKYQDRPCDAGQKSKAMGSTGVDSGGAAAPAPGAPAAGGAAAARARDAQFCAQFGQDALKIVWAREGGATQERLESEAKNSRQREFVRDVYRRRGSASQVQAAVEADCMADRDREAQAAALEAAAARLRGGDTGPGTSPGVSSSGISSPGMSTEPRSQTPAEIQAAEQQRAERAAARKQRTCASLKSEMDDLSARERRGGTASTMDYLREERRKLQSSLSSNGC